MSETAIRPRVLGDPEARVVVRSEAQRSATLSSPRIFGLGRAFCGPRRMDVGGAARQVGFPGKLASAVGSAFMAIPWKLASDAGRRRIRSSCCCSWRRPGTRSFPSDSGCGAGAGADRRDRSRRSVGLAGFTLAGNHLAALAVQQMSPSMMNLLLRAEFRSRRSRLRSFLVSASKAGSGSGRRSRRAAVLLQGAPAGDVGALRVGAGLAIASAACFGRSPS